MISDEIWYGDRAPSRVARGVLAPASWLYRGMIACRNRLYDAGLIASHPAPIPVISVGNLTVGGTGKTPFSAYLVKRLLALGLTPAIVMRGYGDDERLVHERLNPGALVYASPDRVAGIERAARAGADVVVLDDAFQHRRAGRTLDVVLVSADRWRDTLRLLPAGPLREPVTALRRAGLIVVTRKSVSDEAAARVAARLGQITPDVPIATAALRIDQLLQAGGEGRVLSRDVVRGASVLAVAGIGDPGSFVSQLQALGAIVTPLLFADHHGYTAADVARIMSAAANHKYVVTTEKDVVKLGVLWPANGPTLLYVSQAVEISDNESAVTRALENISFLTSHQTAGNGHRPTPSNR